MDVLALPDNDIARTLVDLARRIGRRAELIGSDLLVDGAPGADAAVVICDHDAPFVADALPALLAGPTGYVGMVGSRRRAPQVRAGLRGHGVTEQAIARLHCPLGLDIGGKSAEEIALSALAEIVAVEHDRAGGRTT